MSTTDRFREIVRGGRLPRELGAQPLTPQAKYDFLAAAHSMEQVEEMCRLLEKRGKKREALRRRFEETSRNALRSFLEKEDSFASAKGIEAVINVLVTCHSEFLKLEGEEQEARNLWKVVQEGVSAK